MSGWKKRVAQVIACILLVLVVFGGWFISPVPGICSAFHENITPSKGDVRIPVFVIDFPDVTYEEDALEAEQLETYLFDENDPDSMSAYEKMASYGKLRLTGDVFYYQAKCNAEDYESKEEGFEKLAMEVLDHYDASIDFKNYDSNGDQCLDAFVLSVVSGADETFWWGCQATWWINQDYRLDGMKLRNYIINDAQPYEDQMDYYVNEICHEFGHCMGLADYYHYDKKDDSEGFHGEAGMELMDEMTGDYSQFSKLALGWLTRGDVQILSPKEIKTIYLDSAQKTGGCILIPREEDSGDQIFQKEYFLVEYNTREGNMKGTLQEGVSGIRIFHVNAACGVEEGSDTESFLYNNYNQNYVKGGLGIRILKLVNDGNGYYTDGDQVVFGDSHFAWYDEKGMESIDPGFEIKIGSESKGRYEITLIPSK